MKRVCVFCGSSPGARPAYTELARRLGSILARRGMTLVYGGGNVIGVIPQAMVDLEVAHTGFPDLRIVGSMHERKALMADLADAFIALPGGLGTLEEFCEILTWAQLGMHQKPCGLINVENYFDQLIAFLDDAVRERFVRSEHRAMVLVESDAERMIDRLQAYRPPMLEKWIDREQV